MKSVLNVVRRVAIRSAAAELAMRFPCHRVTDNHVTRLIILRYSSYVSFESPLPTDTYPPRNRYAILAFFAVLQQQWLAKSRQTFLPSVTQLVTSFPSIISQCFSHCRKCLFPSSFQINRCANAFHLGSSCDDFKRNVCQHFGEI